MSAAKKRIQTAHSPEYKLHVIDAAPQKLSVAYDRWNNVENKIGKGFLSFNTRADLWSWYSTQHKRVAYEILRETAPMCVAFDIECDYSKPDHVAVRDALRLSMDPTAFLRSVIQQLCAVFPQLAQQEPIVSTSHKPGEKLSFHLKYAQLYLRDMEHRDRLTLIIREQLATLVPIIDPSVYSLRRQMRLLWSEKLQDPRSPPSPSRPLLPLIDCPVMDRTVFEQHCWTNVPSTAVLLDLSAYESDELDASLMSTSSSSKKPRTASLAPARAVSDEDNAWVEAVRSRLRANKLGSSAECQVHVRQRSKHGPCGDTYFYTGGADRVCPYGKTHDHNNFAVNVMESGYAMLKCFGVDCLKEPCFKLGFLDVPMLLPKNTQAEHAYAQMIAASSGLTPEQVGDAQWNKDVCTFELSAPGYCRRCDSKGVTAFDVSLSRGGKATFGHTKRNGVFCEGELAVHSDAGVHAAFARARQEDSRQLSAEEISVITSALGVPNASSWQRGWSSTLETRITLARGDPAQSFTPYLVFTVWRNMRFTSGKQAVYWLTQKPWLWKTDGKHLFVSERQANEILSPAV
jgi:hypothetical protein